MALVRKGRDITVYVDTSRLYHRYHTVWRWSAEIAKEVVLSAKAEVPVRSGALQRSITYNAPEQTHGRKASYLEVAIWAHKPYAKYVHQGTTGPIYAKNGGWLKMSSTPLGVPGYYEPNDPTVDPKFGTKVGKRFEGGTKFVKFPGAVRSPPGVAGQDPNPFLARALDNVGHKHRWRAGRTRISTGL